MTKPTKETPDSKNWYKDRYQAVLVQRKLLACVTMLSLVCTLAAVLDIARLTPQKSIEPFVIEVDQKSGITRTVDPLTVKELTTNEVVNNFFIVQYIRSRESYNLQDIARNFNVVRIMSDATRVYPGFVEDADPNNPHSNAARLGTTGTRTVKLESITYLKPQLVQIRMLVEEKGDNSGYNQYHKIVLIEFEYVKMNLMTEERYVDPLGFRVTNYRVDDELMQK